MSLTKNQKCYELLDFSDLKKFFQKTDLNKFGNLIISLGSTQCKEMLIILNSFKKTKSFNCDGKKVISIRQLF